MCIFEQMVSTMSVDLSSLMQQVLQNIREVSVNDVAKKDLSTFLFIDVREPAEVEQGRAKGAIAIPRGLLEFQIGNHPLVQDKLAQIGKDLSNAEIVVYCRSGQRSALAADSLQRLGCQNVASMSGGIMAWAQSGLSIVQ